MIGSLSAPGEFSRNSRPGREHKRNRGCARHVDAEVYLYADKVTNAMRQAMDETKRRRELQEAYNTKHGITPESIRKAIRSTLEHEIAARRTAREAIRASEEGFDLTESIADLESEMLAAAEALEFERAAQLRDRIKALKDPSDPVFKGRKRRGRGRQLRSSDATTGPASRIEALMWNARRPATAKASEACLTRPRKGPRVLRFSFVRVFRGPKRQPQRMQAMVPDRRTSKAVKRARRSHHALRAVNFSSCPKCGQTKLPHRACMNCGYVSPKVSIKIKSEES